MEHACAAPLSLGLQLACIPDPYPSAREWMRIQEPTLGYRVLAACSPLDAKSIAAESAVVAILEIAPDTVEETGGSIGKDEDDGKEVEGCIIRYPPPWTTFWSLNSRWNSIICANI